MAEKSELRYIVRVANTDLDGNKGVREALRKIKGVSFTVANAVCYLTKVPTSEKIGALSDEQIKLLDDTIKGAASKLPAWMLNRRHDPVEGADKHLLSADIDFTKEMDLRAMKKTKSYKGLRHGSGLPVRGQRTKSNFRRNKGKALGVARAKQGKKQ